MDRKVLNKNILSVLVFSIFVLLALGSFDGEDTNTDTEKMFQQTPRPRLDYKADTSQIRVELESMGYDVLKVYSEKDEGGMYYVLCMCCY